MKLFLLFVVTVGLTPQAKPPALVKAGDTIQLSGTRLNFQPEWKPKELPKVVLRNLTTETTSSFQLGVSESDLFIDPMATGKSVHLFFIPSSDVRYDVLLPIVMVTGGSDCGYEATVLGMSQGNLHQWLPVQEFTNSQGGYYVGDLGAARGYGFATWNALWEDGAHYGPHRYRFKLYRLNPDSGTAQLLVTLDTKMHHANATEAMKELGLHYINLFHLSRDFDC